MLESVRLLARVLRARSGPVTFNFSSILHPGRLHRLRRGRTLLGDRWSRREVERKEWCLIFQWKVDESVWERVGGCISRLNGFLPRLIPRRWMFGSLASADLFLAFRFAKSTYFGPR